MKGIRSRVLVPVIALLVGAATLSVASPASAATPLGGVDMQLTCDVQRPGPTATVINQNDAYSLRCVGAAYVQQYRSGTYTGLTDTSKPLAGYLQGPSCYGASCVHVDPGPTNCGGSNSTILQQVTVPGGGATVGLKWSEYCHANWARWISGVSPPGYWNYWVETAGHPEGKTFNASEWTFMVNGNLPARACIQGNYDPNRPAPAGTETDGGAGITRRRHHVEPRSRRSRLRGADGTVPARRSPCSPAARLRPDSRLDAPRGRDHALGAQHRQTATDRPQPDPALVTAGGLGGQLASPG